MFMVLPFAIMLAILPNYLNDLSQCLNYEYYLSYLRALAVQTPIFANHFLCEQLGFYPKPFYNLIPEAYGYENNTDPMLRFLLKEMSNAVESVSAYRQYKKNNKDVKPVHNLVFAGVVPVKFYRNQVQTSNSTSTLQGAITDVAMSSSKFIDVVVENNCSQAENVQKCWNLQNTTDFLNPYMNYGVICDTITEALISMNNFLMKNADDIENLAMFICLFVCIVYVLIIMGILIYQLGSLQKYKILIYKCLTSLPKNVVSSVSESLRMIKKNEDDESEKIEQIDSDLNKQEENILKIFSSSGDASSMKSHDKTVLVSASVFLLACSLVCTCLLAFAFPQIAEGLYHNSPQLDYILGTSSFGFSVIGAVDNLILATNCHGIVGNGYDCHNPNEAHTTYIRNYLMSYIKILEFQYNYLF